MKQLIILLLLFSSVASIAQSPFKALPKRTNTYQKGKYGAANTATPTSAFRFTGPVAGFMYPQNQVVTGIGYGWQKLHFVDSTAKYYTDFSVSAVLYAGGNITPSINDHNIISIGVSLGFLNQLFMIGPVYNFPKDGNKGSIGVVANFSVPLNN